MAGKSGFKECSRCGLRNKPTAKQCDFCGQRFDVADEWEQHIDALEELGKSTSQVEVSDEVSRLIESTLSRKEGQKAETEQAKAESVDLKPAPEPVRKEDVEIRAESSPTEPRIILREPEPVRPQPPQPSEIAKPSPMPSPEPVPEPAAPVTVVETVKPPEEKVAPAQVKEPQQRVKKTKKGNGLLGMFKFNLLSKDRKMLPYTILFLGGLVVYLIALVLSSATLTSFGAWGMTIVAGGMVVVGFSRTMMVWNETTTPPEAENDEEIIEMCPDCHERVQPTDEKCPSCGTEFEPSEHQ